MKCTQLTLLLALGLTATAGAKLRVLATTSIVGDVVAAVGGDDIELEVLLPRGSDPHTFEPAPRDLARVYRARVLFENGLGLEASLARLLEGTRLPDTERVPVSAGVVLRRLGPQHDADHDHEGGHGHHAGEADPHVWFDPTAVAVWVENIRQALARLDPARAAAYAERAAAYATQLHELDGWIKAQVEPLPAERRVLLTDHDALGYFADRYGFEVVATVLPGFSTAAEPSARDLAALIDTAQEHRVRAIFVGNTVSPSLIGRLTADTKLRVVPIGSASLAPAGQPGDTYLGFLHETVRTIVDTLAEAR